MPASVDQGRYSFIHRELEVLVEFEYYLFVNSRIFSHLNSVVGFLASVYLDNNTEYSDEK